jgi:hypothetical protein
VGFLPAKNALTIISGSNDHPNLTNVQFDTIAFSKHEASLCNLEKNCP